MEIIDLSNENINEILLVIAKMCAILYSQGNYIIINVEYAEDSISA